MCFSGGGLDHKINIIRPTYRRYDGTITFIQRGVNVCPSVRLFVCPSVRMLVRETHQKDFCIFSLYLCKRNSLEGLVHFFTLSDVTETHQMDLYIFSLYLCKRNSLEGLVHFFTLSYVTETHQKRLVHFFRFERKNYFFIFLL